MHRAPELVVGPTLMVTNRRPVGVRRLDDELLTLMTEAHEQVWINTWIHGLGQRAVPPKPPHHRTEANWCSSSFGLRLRQVPNGQRLPRLR